MAKKNNGSKPLRKLKQEQFCILYASDREFMGNGVQSYIEANDVDLSKKNAYNVAKTQAGRLLSNVDINKRIAFLIEAELNDLQVDKQLSFMVAQNADLKVKLGAVKEYNVLKQRITNKHEHSVDEETATLLRLVDGSSKGKLPTSQEIEEAEE